MSLTLQSHGSKSLLKQNFNFVSDPAKRLRLTTKNSALNTQMYRSTLPSFKTNNSDSEHALRVCLTQNNASLAKQKLNQNSNHINCTKLNSTHASQVHLT